jgi:hypothetical protein
MRRLAFAALLFSLSCSSIFSTEGDGVKVSVVRDDIVVANNTWEPIYTFAIATEDLPLSLLHFCDVPAECDGIESGDRRAIDFPRRARSQELVDEATLFWWHLVPKSGGGFEPDSIRRVPLRRPPF